jgi:hypothetical protein
MKRPRPACQRSHAGIPGTRRRGLLRFTPQAPPASRRHFGRVGADGSAPRSAVGKAPGVSRTYPQAGRADRKPGGYIDFRGFPSWRRAVGVCGRPAIDCNEEGCWLPRPFTTEIASTISSGSIRALRCNRNEELRGRIRAEFTQYPSRRLLEFLLAFRCHRHIHNRFPIPGNSTHSTKGRSQPCHRTVSPQSVDLRRVDNHSSTGKLPAVSCGRRSPADGRCRYGTYFGPNLTINLRRGRKPGTSDEWHRCDPDAHY